jgi:cell division protein FtsZ
VTIRPISIQPKPSLFPEAMASEQPPPELPQPSNFVPPQAERINRAPVRLPRIEDLPLPAQNELRAKRGDAPPAEHPEKRRMGLLQRLAAVGLGRREEGDDNPSPGDSRPPPAVRPAARAPEPRPMPRPAPRPAEPRAPEAISEYAKRPQHQGLDSHGRQTVHNSGDDDQLDIPAFLRRQAN